ncbi:hypothetical protein THAOC_37159, partial [Thalassiosira oceanica]
MHASTTTNDEPLVPYYLDYLTNIKAAPFSIYRGDNHHRQANNIATPRRKSSSRGAAVRILQRPGPAQKVGRAATDMPRHPRTPGSCATSRSVDATKKETPQQRKGASADAKPRHKTLMAPASRGASVSQQQAGLAVQACNILNMQLGRDREFFYRVIGQLRVEVARLQTGRSNEAVDTSGSPGDNQPPVDSRGAYNEAFTAATVLETIPEESAALAVISSTVADDRCTSDGDSSDARRKRIGSPSESVHPTDADGVEDTSALISTSTRDNRVETDVLSSDGEPLRLSTELAQPIDGIPVHGYNGNDVSVQWDADVTHAGRLPTGDEDVAAEQEGDAYAGGALSQQGAIAVAPSVRSTINDLQSVLTAPLTAFTLAPTSGDGIRLINSANRLESQDGGLPPKPKRKRRRNRKRC